MYVGHVLVLACRCNAEDIYIYIFCIKSASYTSMSALCQEFREGRIRIWFLTIHVTHMLWDNLTKICCRFKGIFSVDWMWICARFTPSQKAVPICSGRWVRLPKTSDLESAGILFSPPHSNPPIATTKKSNTKQIYFRVDPLIGRTKSKPRNYKNWDRLLPLYLYLPVWLPFYAGIPTSLPSFSCTSFTSCRGDE